MKLRGILFAVLSLLWLMPAAAQVNPGTSPLSIKKGGTAASTASAARTSLGLQIGLNVEAWDTDLDCIAALVTTGIIHRTGTGTCSAVAVDLTADVVNALPIANGGTGQTSKTLAFNALAPTATRAGDIIYFDGIDYNHLAGNNSGTNVFSENSSGVPSWIAASGTGTVTSAIIAGTAGDIAVTGTCTITTTGTCTIDLAASRKTNPAGCAINATATTTCADGSTGANNGTYTTPSGALWLEIEGIGGGGGGCGSGTSPGAAGTGSATTFGSGPILSSGTAVACSTSAGGTGATSSGGFKVGVSGPGGSGSGANATPGGPGCVSPYGGGGQPGAAGGGAGGAAAANSGSGGGGAGQNTTANGGGGGACGGFFRAIISSPSATYPYAIGSGGAGGTLGTGGAAGGNGGTGHLEIIPHFN